MDPYDLCLAWVGFLYLAPCWLARWLVTNYRFSYENFVANKNASSHLGLGGVLDPNSLAEGHSLCLNAESQELQLEIKGAGCINSESEINDIDLEMMQSLFFSIYN